MSNINLKAIIKTLSVILLVESAFSLVCVPVALIYSEAFMPLVWSALVAFVPGILIFLLTPATMHEKLTSRDGYLIVTLAWLTLSLFGTLPYLFSGTITDFVAALFESASGFTTTGATIFSEVESLPKSILFWRSLTLWIGGIGIIILVIIVLPALKVGGYNFFSLEFTIKRRLFPKTKSVAKLVLLVYLTLTVVESFFLFTGGMDLFDSICHTFGIVASGGFSTKNTSIAGYSSYLQYVIAFFMFISATSYGVIYYFINHDFRKIKMNNEFRFYFRFVAAAIIIVTLILYFQTDRDFDTAFRHSFFQVTSQISTTAYATTDYMSWPVAGWLMMFILMFTGGCTGSTTGGIKMGRILIIFNNMKSMLVRLQHPNAVLPVRLNGKLIPENLNSMMLMFVFVYIIIFILGSFILILSGISVTEAVGASVASMSNVGAGLGSAGNMGNFSSFNDFALGTMIALMIIGRLELFTVLAIFTKSFWKR